MTHGAEIMLPRYKLLDHPRVGRTGGGIALLLRENIQVKRVDSGERLLNGYYSTAHQNCD